MTRTTDGEKSTITDTINICSEFLESEAELSGPFKDLWEFLKLKLNTEPDRLLLKQFKKSPKDTAIHKELKRRLATCLGENQDEVAKLANLNTFARIKLDGKKSEILFKFERERFEAERHEYYKIDEPAHSGRESRNGLAPTRGRNGSIPKLSRDDTSDRTESSPTKDAEGGSIPLETICDAASPETVSRTETGPTPEDIARYVNTGFSLREDPYAGLNNTIPLKTGKEYLFWLSIGNLDPGSIESTPSELPGLVPKDAIVSVVVFGYNDGISVTPGAESGEIQLCNGKPSHVLSQPFPVPDVPLPENSDEKLFFPVIMPKEAKTARMRCNIYWNNLLLQSRLIFAEVVKTPPVHETDTQSLQSNLDYSITSTLDPSLLNTWEPHLLSVLCNTNGNGTQSIFIQGTDKPFHLTFDSHNIQDLMEKSRTRLQEISWGKEQAWKEGDEYRFQDKKPDLDRLQESLIRLAKWGSEFYFEIYLKLEEEHRDVFEQLMVKPGYVQIAIRKSADHVLPAGIFYDYPLDTTQEPVKYDLCPGFKKAFKNKTPLHEIPCFNGECETRERLLKLQKAHRTEECTTICPSGFWGFRHYLGMPITLHEAEHCTDTPGSIPVKEKVVLSACVSTETKFLKQHISALRGLTTFGPALQWKCSVKYAELYEVLKESAPHIVYFYCHGDTEKGALQLHLGTKEYPFIMTASKLKLNEILWKYPRPLVFINGCETAGVEPKNSFGFIEPLIEYSKCAGVIGTEITVFEELATEFSEQFFGYLLSGIPVGKAIRDARLAMLLKQGNPLGLVYNPFVLSCLKVTNQ